MAHDFHHFSLEIHWQGDIPLLELSVEAAQLLGVTPHMQKITLRIEPAPIAGLTRATPMLVKMIEALGQMGEDERNQLVALSQRMAAAFHPPGSEKAELVDPQTGVRKCVTVSHPLKVRLRRRKAPDAD